MIGQLDKRIYIYGIYLENLIRRKLARNNHHVKIDDNFKFIYEGGLGGLRSI